MSKSISLYVLAVMMSNAASFILLNGLEKLGEVQSTTQSRKTKARRIFLKDDTLVMTPHPDIGTAIALSDGSIDVIGTKDIVYGSLWGVGLALSYSFLQKVTSSPIVVPWNVQTVEKDRENKVNDALSPPIDLRDLPMNSTATETSGVAENSKDQTVFSAESWKEISRPENYVFYRKNIDTQPLTRKSKQLLSQSIVKKENRLVLIALLILFVPIFSVEFFLALSRQIMCGYDIFTQPDWARDLCSAYVTQDIVQ